MDFVQRKTADSAVEQLIREASEKGIPLVWDRYEGSLPQCGFCETGLSCRDCLQGPCISHPFKEENKVGVCGKDKEILGLHSFVRLVLQGSLGYLDQLADFAGSVKGGEATPKRKQEAEKVLKEVEALWADGDTEAMKRFPKSLLDAWKAIGVYPDGIAKALFKVSQKVDGGTGSLEDTLLWAFKGALVGCAAQVLEGRLKASVFGDVTPSAVEVNLGVLQKEIPNILLYGHFSPVLKHRIAEEAKKKKVAVAGVCTDPFVPPYSFAPVTNYGSQEIPPMTGAVDLIVAGDQCVNPSLVELAGACKVEVISTEMLKRSSAADFARQMVGMAQEAFEARRNVARNIPGVKESAAMGFSAKNLDAKKVAEGLNSRKIKGVLLLAGCNNVKFTQDNELVSLARELLKEDVLCISEGCASVGLAKYGLLNPKQRDTLCGKGLSALLSSIDKSLPAVVDLGSCENAGVTEFLLALSSAAKKPLKELPIVASFPEANRTKAVARAAWTVAMGVPTYFWPFLPVTGSPKTIDLLGKFCEEKFGARLHVVTQKMGWKEKAELVKKTLKRA